MKTPSNIRLELKYSDPEFQSEAKLILHQFILELEQKKRPRDYINNVKDGNLRSSGMHSFASSELNERYRTLLEQYDLSPAEFTNFFTNSEVLEEDGSSIDIDTPVTIHLPSLDDKSVLIELHPSVTLQDLIDHWGAIKETIDYNFNRNKAKRLRGPSNLQLLMAIHKARISGLSYKEITNQINTDKLSNYTHAKGLKKRWDEQDVKQYYYDYKEYVVKPKR